MRFRVTERIIAKPTAAKQTLRSVATHPHGFSYHCLFQDLEAMPPAMKAGAQG
jgi:hypothetical protein